MVNKLSIIFLFIEIVFILIQLKYLKNLKSSTAKTTFIRVSVLIAFCLFSSLGMIRVAIFMKNEEIVKAKGTKEIHFDELRDIIENKNYGMYSINESELNENTLKDIKEYMPERQNNAIISEVRGSKRYIIFIPKKECIEE